MNEQEIKELVERLRDLARLPGCRDPKMYGSIVTSSEITKIVNAIEHLQSELRAKSERIKEMEKELSDLYLQFKSDIECMEDI